MQPKLTNQQVAYAGENFVAAEIHRIDLLASDAHHDRKIDIEVKTKTAGALSPTPEKHTRQGCRNEPVKTLKNCRWWQ